MGNRSSLIRWWRQIPQTMQPVKKWLQFLGKEAGPYGKPRYWGIYLTAFALGFYLFGPAHGWQNFHRDSPLHDKAVADPGSILTLQREVAHLKKDLAALKAQPAKEELFSPDAFGKPVLGKVAQGYQWVLTNKIWRLHPGVEFQLPVGSNVMAAADGTVLGCEHTPKGVTIIIGHGNEWETVYAQLEKGLVKKGEAVRQGQIIGRSGISQCTTPAQPGFHFGIYHQKEPVDPQKIISGLK